jgi:hypothetical protein
MGMSMSSFHKLDDIQNHVWHHRFWKEGARMVPSDWLIIPTCICQRYCKIREIYLFMPLAPADLLYQKFKNLFKLSKCCLVSANFAETTQDQVYGIISQPPLVWHAVHTLYLEMNININDSFMKITFPACPLGLPVSEN